MLRDLKISAKIMIIVGLLLALLVATGAVMIVYVTRIGSRLTEVAEGDFPLGQLMAEVESAQAGQTHHAERIMHFADVQLIGARGRGHFTEAQWEVVMDESRRAFSELDEEIMASIAMARRVVDESHEDAGAEAMREHDAIEEQLASVEDIYIEYREHIREVIANVDAGLYADALAHEEEIEADEGVLFGRLHEAGAIFGQFAKESISRAKDDEATTAQVVVVMAVVGLVIGGVVGLYVTRAITDPLNAATGIADRISAGDRSVEIDEVSGDETGQLLTAMQHMSLAIAESEEAQLQAYEAQKQTLDELTQRQAEIEEANAEIEAQSETIEGLTTPIIKVADGILLMPLIGTLDTQRASQMTERLLSAISEERARVALVDVTGVPVMDTAVTRHLMSVVDSAAVLGAQAIITGFSPDAAQTLIGLGVDFARLETRGSLQDGVIDAFGLIGRRLLSAEEIAKYVQLGRSAAAGAGNSGNRGPVAPAGQWIG